MMLTVAGMTSIKTPAVSTHVSLTVTYVQNSRIILGKYLNVKLITHNYSSRFVARRQRE